MTSAWRMPPVQPRNRWRSFVLREGASGEAEKTARHPGASTFSGDKDGSSARSAGRQRAPEVTRGSEATRARQREGLTRLSGSESLKQL
eukprot:scaffold53580_cov65-Phaeocystis_antarctica.AAC.11